MKAEWNPQKRAFRLAVDKTSRRATPRLGCISASLGGVNVGMLVLLNTGSLLLPRPGAWQMVGSPAPAAL